MITLTQTSCVCRPSAGKDDRRGRTRVDRARSYTAPPSLPVQGPPVQAPPEQKRGKGHSSSLQVPLDSGRGEAKGRTGGRASGIVPCSFQPTGGGLYSNAPLPHGHLGKPPQTGSILTWIRFRANPKPVLLESKKSLPSTIPKHSSCDSEVPSPAS